MANAENVERDARETAVVEAAEVWARLYRSRREGAELIAWIGAQRVLDEAVAAYRAHRKGQGS